MFKEDWEGLEKGADTIKGKGIYKRMIGHKSQCPLFIGIKQPGMNKAFVVQIPKMAAPVPDDLDESKGFDFTVKIAGDEIDIDHVSMVLSSKNLQYNSAIESISEILYSKLSPLENPIEVRKIFLEQVKLLQIFFEKQDPAGLSEDAQQGLYGELFFLDKHILRDEKFNDEALNSWTGPLSRQHDFQFGAVCLEVKTTSSKVHQKLKIASEQQLDETLVDKLFLYYLSVSLVQNHRETLPNIIDRIREKLSNRSKASSLFESALLARGYLDGHREKYDLIGYSIRDTKFFRVEGEFPRIKETQLTKGIGDVSYSIAVSECLPYEVSEKNFLNEIRGQ